MQPSNVWTDQSSPYSGQKQFTCTVCDNAFSLKDDLDRHIRTHTGEKPYQCILCDESFANKVSLDMHVQICVVKICT